MTDTGQKWRLTFLQHCEHTGLQRKKEKSLMLKLCAAQLHFRLQNRSLIFLPFAELAGVRPGEEGEPFSSTAEAELREKKISFNRIFFYSIVKTFKIIFSLKINTCAQTKKYVPANSSLSCKGYQEGDGEHVLPSRNTKPCLLQIAAHAVSQIEENVPKISPLSHI